MTAAPKPGPRLAATLTELAEFHARMASGHISAVSVPDGLDAKHALRRAEVHALVSRACAQAANAQRLATPTTRQVKL